MSVIAQRCHKDLKASQTARETPRHRRPSGLRVIYRPALARKPRLARPSEAHKVVKASRRPITVSERCSAF
jgi:hypothetical protein